MGVSVTCLASDAGVGVVMVPSAGAHLSGFLVGLGHAGEGMGRSTTKTRDESDDRDYPRVSWGCGSISVVVRGAVRAWDGGGERSR